MNLILNMIFGWEEILVTPNIDIYIKIKEKLKDNNIKFNSNIEEGMKSRNDIHSKNKIYYLYVKKKDLSKAKNIISNKK